MSADIESTHVVMFEIEKKKGACGHDGWIWLADKCYGKKVMRGDCMQILQIGTLAMTIKLYRLYLTAVSSLLFQARLIASSGEDANGVLD
eukprot:1160827-Pelagomonas_calceolata.AAC.2